MTEKLPEQEKPLSTIEIPGDWENIPPNLRGEAFLETLTPKAFKDMQNRGRGLMGFIIAGWASGEINPSEYYEDDLASFPGERPPLAQLGDETRAEEPKIYKAKASLLRKLEELRSLDSPKKLELGIALWRHPEHYAEPLEKWLLQDKGQFPGSPTQ